MYQGPPTILPPTVTTEGQPVPAPAPSGGGGEAPAQVHPEFQKLMALVLKRHKGRVSASKALSKIGKTSDDLPWLQGHTNDKGVSRICWNYLLGVCERGSKCIRMRTQGGIARGRRGATASAPAVGVGQRCWRHHRVGGGHPGHGQEGRTPPPAPIPGDVSPETWGAMVEAAEGADLAPLLDGGEGGALDMTYRAPAGLGGAAAGQARQGRQRHGQDKLPLPLSRPVDGGRHTHRCHRHPSRSVTGGTVTP